MRIPRLDPLHDRSPVALVAAAWLVLGAAWGALAGDLGSHPQDGPDAELRIAVREDHVLVRVRLNLVFADLALDVPREAEERIDPVEEPAYAEALGELLRQHLEVRIDGQPARFEAQEFSVLPALDSLIGMFPRYGARALVQLQLPLRFPCETPPQQVAIRWDLFPHMEVVPGGPSNPVAIPGQLNDGRYDTPLLLTQEEPEFIWHGEVQDPGEAFLAVPLAATEPNRPAPILALVLALPLGLALGLARRRPGLAGLCLALDLAVGLLTWPRLGREFGLTTAPTGPTPEQSKQIFESLLKNLYTAFDYDKPSAIYDALARSAEGPMLQRAYAEIYGSLILEDEGGAMARVEAVRPETTELEHQGVLPDSGRRSFLVKATWQVDAKVTHFGHSHARTNQYTARFTVAEAEGRWRLIGEEPVESRVLSATSTLPVR